MKMKLLSVLRLCGGALCIYIVLMFLGFVIRVIHVAVTDGGDDSFDVVNRKENPLEIDNLVKRPRKHHQKVFPRGLKKTLTINLATVACGNVQLVTNMLKTAVLFSQDANLHVIIFTDEETMPILKLNMIPRLEKMAQENLGATFTYEMHMVSFPDAETGVDWHRMYLNCTNQRLFFPSLLPHIDSLIYLDTDTLVMGNLSEFWTEFSRMDQYQLAAASQNTEYLHAASIYNPSRGHPYFGPRGLNAGIMLMNLTRMRAFHFEQKVVEVYKKYWSKITLADQDILNIFFHQKPQLMKTLSCIFNFYWIHCPWKLEQNEGKNICRWWHNEDPVCFCNDIYTRGVYIVHGNYDSFFKSLDDSEKSMFPWIYKIWHEYRYGDSLDELLLTIAMKYKNYECFMSGRDLVQNAITYFMNLNSLQFYNQTKPMKRF